MTIKQSETPRKRLSRQDETELYIRLMEILQEFQLPSGKLDGHGLITALANAKQHDELKRDLRECVELLRPKMPGEIDYAWVARRDALLARLKETK